MKNKTGDGTVYKLKGKRRRPWIARKAIGSELISKTEYEWVDRKTGKVIANPTDEQFFKKEVKKRRKRLNESEYTIQEIIEMWKNKEVSEAIQYINIGYFESKLEACAALNAYNKNPYDLHLSEITFEEVYDKWSDEHFQKVSDSNVKGYQAAFNTSQPLWKMKLVDITIDHMQKVIDESGKNTPTLKKVKGLWILMFKYAVLHDYVTEDRCTKVKSIDISKPGNPNAYNRQPFSKKEVETVWKWKDTNEYIPVILMLIYSGVRISELLDLKKENVNLEERWFDVIASKTEAGIRKVPICDRILPYFEYWMNKNDCDYLLSTPDGKHFEYRNYYDSYWTPFINQMGMEHRPHDTRHTCVSMLAAAGVDERLTKKIVGHKGQGVTETVYTHFEIEELLDAINKI